MLAQALKKTMRTRRDIAFAIFLDRGIDGLEILAKLGAECDCGRCLCCESKKLADEYWLADHYVAATKEG
jgi:hypothetical protein